MLHDYAIQNIPEAKQFRENLRYIINDNRKIKDNIIFNFSIVIDDIS